MPQNANSTISQRRKEIQTLFQRNDSLSIAQLAETFSVSEMTVRRDLDWLERKGRVRRTHGGAVTTERMTFEFDFVARRQANRAAKQAIAREAVKLVSPGNTLILDTGTTTLELAHLLKEFDRLTVITPSLAVASELQYSPGVETVLLGGVIRKGNCDLTGLVTETVLDMFMADIAFQGADGIDNDGALYTADMHMARVDQKIRSRARKTYILADSTKLGQAALTRHGYIQQADALITDEPLPAQQKKNLRRLGAEVILAGMK